MRVALCIRKEFQALHGGDTVQLIETRNWLKKLFSIETEIITSPSQLDKSFDIVHIFNLATRTETRNFFHKAEELKSKIALSTIFWDYTYQATRDFASAIGYQVYAAPGLIQLFTKLNALSSSIIGKPRIISAPFRYFVQECLLRSDLLLPNSIEELIHAANFASLDYHSLLPKTQVVVNATNASLEGASIENFHKTYELPENYILQVGRIEYIKNQLVLLEALKGNPELPIVFVGRPNDRKYYELIKRKGGKRGNVFFRNEVPHQHIHSFFQHAKLHVLPSMRESPGLVNLEALQNGCPIVVSDHRFLPFDSYFKGLASPVNPLSPESVKMGILNELKTKRDMAGIRELISSRFSWEAAARQTYAGYQTLM
jgi:glycosyltransferase involved in cell wall biosynthesis